MELSCQVPYCRLRRCPRRVVVPIHERQGDYVTASLHVHVKYRRSPFRQMRDGKYAMVNMLSLESSTHAHPLPDRRPGLFTIRHIKRIAIEFCVSDKGNICIRSREGEERGSKKGENEREREPVNREG